VPPREQTERQCALTREVRPIADLIRFAVSPDGAVVPDTDGKAEGRGVWITLGEKSVAEAVKKKAFARSLKASVEVPAELAALTRRRLEERLLNALSLARKAGQLMTGAFKVKAALEAGDAVALLTATDGAADGRNKMLGTLRGALAAAREAGLNPPETPHFELLDSVHMGLALGIENVIHAALIKGGAAEAAVKRAERLARYIAN
jgi:predicted RNA-binding protein YlxR (DUF448 family)